MKKGVMILIVLLLMPFVTANSEQIDICKDYEKLIKDNTKTVTTKIDQSKIDFQKGVTDVAQSVLVNLDDIMQNAGKRILTYLVIGIFGIQGMAIGVFNYFRWKKEKELYLSRNEQDKKLFSELAELRLVIKDLKTEGGAVKKPLPEVKIDDPKKDEGFDKLTLDSLNDELTKFGERNNGL